MQLAAKTEQTYPAALKTLLERANAGDQSVLPALRQALHDNPELSQLLGDLVQHAEMALLELAGGKSIVAKEAITRRSPGKQTSCGLAWRQPALPSWSACWSIAS